jgi:cytochrome c oxidase cbb3-type subunit 2
MKSLPLIFLGVFFTLAFSWTGIVLSSYLQLGDLEPSTTTLVDREGNRIPGVYIPPKEDSDPLVVGQVMEGETLYPNAYVGSAQRGMKVYGDLGCYYCHSQQVRREGFGSDFERGWGNRQSVARDYIFQERVMLGTMRTGPDLTNVGTRYSELWQHQHLYMPQSINDWSIMPPFAFLYSVQPISERGPSPDAITPLDSWEIPEGYEVVPSQRAKDLVAYMMALNQNYELPEMKFSQ